MIQVRYERILQSYGKHRFAYQSGIELSKVGNYVNLFPITSRGDTSHAVMLQIPVESIDAVIQALEKVKNECRQWHLHLKIERRISHNVRISHRQSVL